MFKYFTIGMHGIPLDVAENYALPEGKILPDYLKVKCL